MLNLLASRRFLPLFVTQFLGAANDNLFKNALVVLVAYRLGETAGIKPSVMVTLAGGIFILPFFLLSAVAGQLADSREKTALIRWVKLAELALMALAAAGFVAGNAWFLVAVLFGMGVHSTFFGPIKYAILPEHLKPEELVAGNALVEAGTFLAILLGTVAGGLLVLAEHGPALVSVAALAVAALGLAACLFIPKAPPPVPGLRLRLNIVAETAALIGQARANRPVFRAILGISWFWLVGATVLAQLPVFTKDVLGGDNTVVTLFLAVFSVGVGLGSLACARLFRGSLRAVPWAGAAISLFTLDLALFSSPMAGEGLGDVARLLAGAGGWRTTLDLLGLSMAGGVFAVPLYTAMQAKAERGQRARAVAANNVLNAAFMVASAGAAAGLLAAGTSVPGVLVVLAVANLGAAWLLRRLGP